MRIMESKQTAIEWLSKELEGYGSPSALNIAWETFDELIAQAKAMEKGQIVESHEQSYIEMNMAFRGADRAEQYYNETYGK